MDGTEIQLLFISVLVVTFLIALPSSLYGIRLFVGDWFKSHFVKRHRILVIGIMIGVCIIIYITIPIFAIDFLIFGDISQIGFYSGALLTMPAIYICILCICLRLWFLYFDIHLTKYQLEEIWLSAMNPSINNPKSNEQNWFLKYESTLGNSKYLMKFGIIFILLFSFLSCFLRLNPFIDLSNVDRILNGIIWIFVGLFNLIIWYHLKGLYFQDTLGIKKELYYTFIIAFIFVFGHIGITLLYAFGILNWIWFNYFWCINTLWFGMSGILLNTLLPVRYCVSTTSKKKKTKKSETSTNTIHRCICCCESCICNSCCDTQTPNGMSLSGTTTTASASDASPRNTDTRNNRGYSSAAGAVSFGSNWFDVVCTGFGYESLMTHLESEFSIENLLLITEYMQVKNVLSDHLNQVMEQLYSNNINTRFTIELPDMNDIASAGTNAAPGALIRKSVAPLMNQKEKDKEQEKEKEESDLMHSSNTRDKKIVPLSLIAKELHQDLIKLLSENENNINENDDDDIDDDNVIIGNRIVDCFTQLYIKYIREIDCPFMVNIKSNTRKELRDMLDVKHYGIAMYKKNNSINNMYNNNNNNNNINNSNAYKKRMLNHALRNDKIHKDSSKNSINMIAIVDSNTNDNINYNDNNLFIPPKMSKSRQLSNRSILKAIEEKNENWIKRQIIEMNRNFKRSKNNNNKNNCNGKNKREIADDSGNEERQEFVVDNQLLLWLLTKLIVATERAVVEVSNLMGDSYLRFKRIHQETFETALQYAIEKQSRSMHAN